MGNNLLLLYFFNFLIFLRKASYLTMQLAKYQIIIALLLVAYSSNSNDVKVIKKLYSATYQHLFISKSHKLFIEKIFCPFEGNLPMQGCVSKCTLCDDGKTRSLDIYDKCDLCLPGLKKTLTKDGNFICSKCEMDNLYLPDRSDAGAKSCRATECSIEEYFDLEKEKCIKCSKHLKNSIGRRPGTLPLMEYCSCSENDLKMFNSPSFECISFGKLGIAKNHIIDSFEKNYREVIIIFRQNSYIVYLTFYHCHPKIRFFSQERTCLCDEGFQFFDGMCEPCLISSISNTYDNLKCKTCSKNEIISNDKTKCLCKNGYFRETMNYSKCKKCPIFYTTDQLNTSDLKNCTKLKAKLVLLISLLLLVLLISVVTSMVLIINRYKENKRKINSNHYTIIVQKKIKDVVYK